MIYNIVWALRFAPVPLLAGFAMIGLAGYSLLIYGPSLDPTAPWVPATFAFGDAPWYGALFIGVLLFLYALRIGANARRGIQ